MRRIALSHQTVLADLITRCIDAEFSELLSPHGSLQKAVIKDRTYWYYVTPMLNGIRSRRSIGPADDPEVASRVARFQALKDDTRERVTIVRSLKAAGLPEPTRMAGEVIAALAQAGIFRLRGVLVGSVAFQTYAAYLGVLIPDRLNATNDVDFAQFHSISQEVGDSLPEMVATLQAVDPSFVAIPHMADRMRATKYRNASKFEVEFLTPNYSSDDYQGKPAAMPALGGASAEPLRFLDFLIHEPVRSLLLHRGGIAVTVPAPERYAIHKLIVSAARQEDLNGRAKADKDTAQVAALVEALCRTRRTEDLGLAWIEAWQRGPSWHERLEQGVRRLAEEPRQLLYQAIQFACRITKENPEECCRPESFEGAAPAP